MMLGLSLAAFTDLHTIISLAGIAAGIVFFGALALTGQWRGTANGLFLVFTILTSVTGFLFPIVAVTPAVIFGIVSLLLFTVALYALYGRGWRRLYLAAALIAQWLNMVVLIVQSYQKIPALNALAPTGSEPAVLASQAVLFAAIALTGWRILWRPRAMPA